MKIALKSLWDAFHLCFVLLALHSYLNAEIICVLYVYFVNVKAEWPACKSLLNTDIVNSRRKLQRLDPL